MMFRSCYVMFHVFHRFVITETAVAGKKKKNIRKQNMIFYYLVCTCFIVVIMGEPV